MQIEQYNPADGDEIRPLPVDNVEYAPEPIIQDTLWDDIMSFGEALL